MHFLFALRNLKKRPFLNLIKIVGLSLSLSGVLLIGLYLDNELSYDRFHEKSDRIYRLTLSNRISGQHFARLYRPAYIPAFAQDASAVSNYVRLVPVRGGVLKHQDKFIDIEQGFQCDSTFFEVFDAELPTGTSSTILDEPGSMVVSRSFAERVFGEENPIGQTFILPQGQHYHKEAHFTVKAVMNDFPQNSHFHPEFIVSPVHNHAFNHWAWTYLLLADQAAPTDVKADFKRFFASAANEEAIEKMGVCLQNILAIHLHSHKLREIEQNSNVSLIYAFFLAGLVLLLIALINYANLNMGMAGFSERYLFISKTFGASVRMNLKYFFTEGLLILLASLIMGVLIIALAHHAIAGYFGLELFQGNITWVVAIVATFCILVTLAGVLPVIKYVFRYRRSYAGAHYSAPITKGLSKPLMVVQYTISIGLIIAVFVIHKQTSYALEKSMGKQAPHMICMENIHLHAQKRFEVFKQELLEHPSVESVSAMMEDPGGEINDKMPFEMEGYQKDPEDKLSQWITVLPCDYSFAKAFDLDFLAGSNFSNHNNDREGSGEYIINTSAMHKLNYTEPSDVIGKRFNLKFPHGNIKIPRGKIIGVVEDFHFSSLKKKVQPMVLFKREALWLMNYIIAFRPHSRQQALAAVEQVWNEIYPSYPLQYQYVSGMYRNVYQNEIVQGRLLSVFTFMALFICSMGLLGMSLLITRRRAKEIGIRKVNGGRSRQILAMLNWYLIKWIVISLVLAIPLASWIMRGWLENFAYHISLDWWIYVLAGGIAVFVSLLTVSVNSWKAATRNPVEVLREE